MDECLDNFLLTMDDKVLRECSIKEGKRLIETGESWLDYCERMQDFVEPELIRWWRETGERMVDYGNHLVNHNRNMLLLEEARTNPYPHGRNCCAPYTTSATV